MTTTTATATTNLTADAWAKANGFELEPVITHTDKLNGREYLGYQGRNPKPAIPSRKQRQAMTRTYEGRLMPWFMDGHDTREAAAQPKGYTTRGLYQDGSQEVPSFKKGLKALYWGGIEGTATQPVDYSALDQERRLVHDISISYPTSHRGDLPLPLITILRTAPAANSILPTAWLKEIRRRATRKLVEPRLDPCPWRERWAAFSLVDRVEKVVSLVGSRIVQPVWVTV